MLPPRADRCSKYNNMQEARTSSERQDQGTQFPLTLALNPSGG